MCLSHPARDPPRPRGLRHRVPTEGSLGAPTQALCRNVEGWAIRATCAHLSTEGGGPRVCADVHPSGRRPSCCKQCDTRRAVPVVTYRVRRGTSPSRETWPAGDCLWRRGRRTTRRHTCAACGRACSPPLARLPSAERVARSRQGPPPARGLCTCMDVGAQQRKSRALSAGVSRTRARPGNLAPDAALGHGHALPPAAASPPRRQRAHSNGARAGVGGIAHEHRLGHGQVGRARGGDRSQGALLQIHGTQPLCVPAY